VEEALLALIKAVETVAPEVWRIAMLRANAQMVSHAMTLVVEALVLFVLIKSTRKAGKYAKETRDHDGSLSDEGAVATMVQLGFGILAVGVGISMLILTQELIYLVMAPEWFAVRQLLDLVK